MAASPEKFPNDHYIEALRGARRLPANRVRRNMASMAARLAVRFDRALKEGAEPKTIAAIRDDMTAIVQAMEAFEREHPASGDGKARALDRAARKFGGERTTP